MSTQFENTKPRILVVDDIEDNYELMARALTRAGYDVEVLDNGVDAIAHVSTNPPDLVLLDWMMPQLSGMEVLIAMRERYDANELPIVMCTAKEEASCITDAIASGANDYLQKPVEMSTALARIQAQLERRSALLSLSNINKDLEETLAQRTRALLGDRGNSADASSACVTTSDIQELKYYNLQ